MEAEKSIMHRTSEHIPTENARTITFLISVLGPISV